MLLGVGEQMVLNLSAAQTWDWMPPGTVHLLLPLGSGCGPDQQLVPSGFQAAAVKCRRHAAEMWPPTAPGPVTRRALARRDTTWATNTTDGPNLGSF